VCYFYPAGNIKGEFCLNVSKIEVQSTQTDQADQAVQAAGTIESSNSCDNQTSQNDFSLSDS